MRRKILLSLVLVAFLAGCATMGGVTPWVDKTPKQKATFFFSVYNSQFTDTLTLAHTPNISEAQKELVRFKKGILEKVYPLIKGYDMVVAAGGIPGPDEEAAILSLINQLTTAGTK